MTKYSKKVLFRADDLGYSEAVNYGIEKAVKKGLIQSVGVMVNMPAALHGVELLKNEPIAFSQHTNICVGKPLADPEKIPSLVDADGNFKSSKIYREAKEDFVVFSEVMLEIEAQYQCFLALFGRKPDYFEGHAVTSANYFKAMEQFAVEHGLKYSGLPQGQSYVRWSEAITGVVTVAMTSWYELDWREEKGTKKPAVIPVLEVTEIQNLASGPTAGKTKAVFNETSQQYPSTRDP